MERRNGFLTFICSLVPGIGYMYLGLMNRGIEALLVFLLIHPVFNIIGLRTVGNLIRIAIWFYTFFDTFNIASKIDRGECVQDIGFLFKKDFKFNKDFKSEGFKGFNNEGMSSIKKNKHLIGWVFVIFGSLAVINNVFQGSDIYYLIKSSISAYFLPVLFILGGVYILYKK